MIRHTLTISTRDPVEAARLAIRFAHTVCLEGSVAPGMRSYTSRALDSAADALTLELIGLDEAVRDDAEVDREDHALLAAQDAHEFRRAWVVA